jgi:hypothetical protein
VERFINGGLILIAVNSETYSTIKYLFGLNKILKIFIMKKVDKKMINDNDYH